MGDPYEIMENAGTFKPRLVPATDDGTRNGNPLFLTDIELANVKRDTSTYIFSCQYLQSPVLDSAQTFNPEWLRFYDPKDVSESAWRKMRRYMVCDPASKKRKTSDFTVIYIIGVNRAGDYYVLDIVRDRLNMVEKLEKVFALHEKWQPEVVGYEEFAMQADIEVIKMRQKAEMYTFNIIELRDKTPKEDKIKRLMPVFQQGKIYFPKFYVTQDWEGTTVNLTEAFKAEYLNFPNITHDDMLDGLSMILYPDLKVRAASGNITQNNSKILPFTHKKGRNTNWMTM